MFARVRSWIETAMPLPRIFIMRVAAADRDRADAHVTIVDVPAFLRGSGRSAAGEFGHAALKRGLTKRERTRFRPIPGVRRFGTGLFRPTVA
jgi:hypothetical protein